MHAMAGTLRGGAVAILLALLAHAAGPAAADSDAARRNASAGNAAQKAPGNCRNPLFQTHWAGKSDIRHLAGKPTAQMSLRLCPMYNGRGACCTAAFEEAMQRAFGYWVQHFKNMKRHIVTYRAEMAAMKASSPIYVKADRLEQFIFSKALTSFAPVERLLGTCFDTLLEYMAGAICYSCDPQWRSKVDFTSDGLGIEYLHIHQSTGELLWQSCRPLGVAAVELRRRIADSALSRQLRSAFEDLSVFSTRVGIVELMGKAALVALRGPNQLPVDQPGVKGQGAGKARALAAGPAKAVRAGENQLYLVRDGRQSGFHCQVFPRVPLGEVADWQLPGWQLPSSSGATLPGVALGAVVAAVAAQR